MVTKLKVCGVLVACTSELYMNEREGGEGGRGIKEEERGGGREKETERKRERGGEGGGRKRKYV